MKEIQGNQMKHERNLQLVGWILFVICALFFIASSLNNRDILTFIGSVFFLISCIIFIIPLVKNMKNSEDRYNKSYNQANAADPKSRAADKRR